MDQSENEENSWSNRTCIEIARKNHFPTAVKNLAVQKRIINKFLNFYLGGKKEKGINVADVIFAAIAILPLHQDTEEFIWPDFYYHDDGTLFFLTPEDKLSADYDCTNNVPREDQAAGSSGQQTSEEPGEKATDETKIKYTSSKEFKQETTVSDDSCPEKESNQENSGVDDQKVREEVEKEEDEEEDEEENDDAEEGQDLNNGIPKFNHDIRWFGSKTKIYDKDVPIEYGPVQNAAFVAECNEFLAQWDSSSKARINLKSFFGIVGLTLMRATTKSFKHLQNFFSGTKFRRTVGLFINRYSNPHKKCILNSHRKFSKRDESTSIMFARIVVNSFRIDALLRDQQSFFTQRTSNIFKITVLAHTAGFGLGLVGILQTILNKEGGSCGGSTTINLVIEATHCEETATSWNRLTRCLEKYMASTSKESTHHWARVIDRNHFQHLTCANNYPLAVIFAVFVEKITENQGIWKSAWITKDDQETMNYKELGRRMYETYKLERDTRVRMDFRLFLMRI